MPRFTLRYLVSPSWVFGLPDGKKVVLPAGSHSITTSSIDMRTGQVAGHGTLPVYRLPAAALSLVLPGQGLELQFQDNYLSLGVEADSVQAANERGGDVVDLLCQALSVHYGVRFSASLRYLEDAEGNPKQLVRPRAIPLMEMASFNLEELKDRIGIAFEWAQTADERAR